MVTIQARRRNPPGLASLIFPSVRRPADVARVRFWLRAEHALDQAGYPRAVRGGGGCRRALGQLEGDTASGRAYVLSFGHMRDGSSHLNYSVYYDRYRRTPAGRSAAARVDYDTGAQEQDRRRHSDSARDRDAAACARAPVQRPLRERGVVRHAGAKRTPVRSEAGEDDAPSGACLNHDCEASKRPKRSIAWLRRRFAPVGRIRLWRCRRWAVVRMTGPVRGHRQPATAVAGRSAGW
jgi:hypothetical protein